MELLKTKSIDRIDKARNVAFAFVIILIWNISIHILMCLIVGVPIVLPHHNTITVASVFFTCVMAPLWEELAFRVAPLTVAKYLGDDFMLPIMIISCIIFGWGHGYGPVSLLFQGVTGFIFCCVYVKNNYCYISVVLLHASWNLFCTVFL